MLEEQLKLGVVTLPLGSECRGPAARGTEGPREIKAPFHYEACTGERLPERNQS